MKLYPDRIEKGYPEMVPNPYGPGYTEDWTNATWEEIDIPVSIQPMTSTENVDGASNVLVVTGYRLISAPGRGHLPIDTGDRVRKVGDNTVLLIDGTPAHWGAPLPHTEARIEDFRLV